jgi:hypothetical protein
MKKFLVFMLLAATQQANAADAFSDRISKARKIERSPEAQPVLMDFMNETHYSSQNAMGKCFKDGEPPSYTLVADLLANGTISNVEIQPTTPALECYRQEFQKITFKTSIPAKYRENGIPIFIKTTWKH